MSVVDAMHAAVLYPVAASRFVELPASRNTLIYVALLPLDQAAHRAISNTVDRAVEGGVESHGREAT